MPFHVKQKLFYSKIVLTKCPLCSSDNHVLRLATQDYFFSNEQFSIYECKDCGHIFTNPQPSESDLGLFYHSDQYLSHKEDPETTVEKLYAFIRRINLQTKYRQATHELNLGQVLDYGCGRGDFLQLAKEKGWSTFGIEMDADARRYANERNGIPVFSPNEESHIMEGQLNLVTLFHVLEHVADLHAAMAKFNRWLANDGRLVLALPNPESFDANYYGKYWAGWDVPRHLHHFSKQSLIKLTNQHGFRIQKIYPMYWDAFFVSMMSEQYKTSNLTLLRAGIVGAISNLVALRSKQYSSLLYVCSKSL